LPILYCVISSQARKRNLNLFGIINTPAKNWS
jgi:hypothetical protein